MGSEFRKASPNFEDRKVKLTWDNAENFSIVPSRHRHCLGKNTFVTQFIHIEFQARFSLYFKLTQYSRIKTKQKGQRSGRQRTPEAESGSVSGTAPGSPEGEEPPRARGALPVPRLGVRHDRYGK